MHIIRNILTIAIILILIVSCKKDSEKSSDTSISNFTVTNISKENLTLDQIYIDEENYAISLLFSVEINSNSLPLSLTPTFDIPGGAVSVPAAGESITFTNIDEPITITITAENGTVKEYSVILRDNQIPNSGFEYWYTAQGLNSVEYSECGKSENTTVWATANYGTSTYGIYGTIPVTVGSNTMARIRTNETTTIPLTAGTLYTGKFDFQQAVQNPTNPKLATTFGIPFSLRPTAFKFKYTYTPGTRYIKATPNNPTNIFGGFTIEDIAGSDMFTAYVVLEKRSLTDTVEIGRAEINSGDLQETMKEIILPFNYTSQEKPTHIYVVFSSSKDGDLFTGSVGSALTIDDLELVYQ